MTLKKLFNLGLIVTLLLAGVWLLGRSSALAPETTARQQAILRAAAPAGVDSSVAAGQAEAVSMVPVEPVTVNLADIPTGVYDPNNQYDRWIRGEIDMEAVGEGRVTPAEVAALQANAAKLSANSNVQLATSGPGLNAPALLNSFDSLDINDCCGGGANVPPDPEMAAGPNHLIAVVNVAFEVYNKSGTVLAGPITFASFFATQPLCVAPPYGAFDPTVVYDEEANRFAIGVDGNGTHYCIAASATSDPLGAWHVYAVPANFSAAFHDYPHTGVGDNYIVVGANQFGGVLPNGFEGRVWALTKSQLYAGTALTFHTASTTDLYGTPQPLHLHGFNQGTWPSYGNTHYFVTDLYDGCTMQVWQWDIPSAPTIVNSINLCAATGVTGGFPVNARQSGGGAIQANDWRMRMFEYRNGHAWTTDTIACNPGGGAVDCVRWAEVDLSGTPSLVQAGVYSSSGDYRIFPDLAVNDCGDMAIGYTKTNRNIFPSIWYTGRESGDPAGTLQAEAQLKAGEISYTAFDPVPRRWGDYTGMTIDPDGQTFWYLGEYSKITGNANGRWGNYIGSFNYSACAGGGGGEDTMHVGDLDGVGQASGSQWRGRVTVTVHDADDTPVSGATVSFTITPSSGGGPFSASCTTNSTGRCNASSPKVAGSVASLTFTVNSVTHGTLTYDSGDNHDPDGDSNGTTIVVVKP